MFHLGNASVGGVMGGVVFLFPACPLSPGSSFLTAPYFFYPLEGGYRGFSPLSITVFFLSLPFIFFYHWGKGKGKGTFPFLDYFFFLGLVGGV